MSDRSRIIEVYELRQRIAELPHLARMVILMLDQQQKYFKTRAKEDLVLSKQLEQQLRQLAELVLLED